MYPMSRLIMQVFFVNILVSNVNFASAAYLSIWEKQKHTNAIVKAKMGEDGVLAEYLRLIFNCFLTSRLLFFCNNLKQQYFYS